MPFLRICYINRCFSEGFEILFAEQHDGMLAGYESRQLTKLLIFM